MNWLRIVVGIVLYCIFFLTCYFATGTDKKNMGGFRSYPDEVQKRLREDTTLRELAPKKLSVSITILSNILMFTIVFIILGVCLKSILGLANFKTVFIYFLILGEGLNVFDLVVIDLLWWRNSKRIRFSCIPEKEAYQNPKKHVDSYLRGIPTFAVVAVIVALILNCL
ncbi:MAG: ABC transporter permease [Lachnospiraceae bacterium]|nr:ABC transporter permease [Lachnospiraceae bacterium]